MNASSFAQDGDADGILDGADAFPCDVALAGEAFVPAEGRFGALLFEDQWPNIGDADFNDVVLAYNYALRLDHQGRVVGLTATYSVLALGGTYDNGLGLHLPAAAAGATVTRTVGGVTTALSPSAHDSELTVVVSSNLREVFGHQAGQINSVSGPSASGQTIVVDVRFGTPMASHLVGSAPFDLFVFRSSNPAHEIHRSSFGGSARMDTSLFGTGSDRSTQGRFFVDVRNLPFVLDIPVIDVWPEEATDISRLFPNIIPFATSGGATHQDFYVNGIDATHAYSGTPAVSPPSIAPTVADRACTRATAVSGASWHSCALMESGSIQCWGGNWQGQLGSGDTTPSWTPRPVTGISDAVEVQAGFLYTCARRADGTLECWGNNDHGQLGIGSVGGFSSTPIAVPGLPPISQFSLHSFSACAVDESGRVWCWGSNTFGDLGDNSTTQRATPVQVVGLPPARRVMKGFAQTCAELTDGAVWCWGANHHGQLGRGFASNQELTPAPMSPGLGGIRAANLTDAHGCAARTDGSVACWGRNDAGQLGNGAFGGPYAQGEATWSIAGGPADVVQLDGTFNEICVVEAAGAVWCWGNNDFGQVGDAMAGTHRSTPFALPGVTDAVHVSTGLSTCVVRADGSVWCLGLNDQGQLGDGTNTDRTQLVRAL